MNLPHCQFGECYLPENNNKYLYQLVYLFISLCVLICTPEQFNFFSLALYIAPILLDLLCTPVDKLKFLRVAFIVVNAVLLSFSILGLFNVVEDNGLVFSVTESALLFSQFAVEKRSLAFVPLLNLLMPFVYLVGAPCKRKKQRIQEMKEVIHH